MPPTVPTTVTLTSNTKVFPFPYTSTSAAKPEVFFYSMSSPSNTFSLNSYYAGLAPSKDASAVEREVWDS